MTPEDGALARRGAIVAASAFLPFALALVVLDGGFSTRPPTADSGAMVLLVPVVFAIFGGVVAIGAGLLAGLGAIAAVLSARPRGAIVGPAFAIVSGLCAALLRSGEDTQLGQIHAALPDLVAGALVGLPVWFAGIAGRRHAAQRSEGAVERAASPRPAAPRPAAPGLSTAADRLPSTSALARHRAGRPDRVRALRVAPLLLLCIGGAILTGGLLLAAPELGFEPPVAWLLQPWLPLFTAGRLDADRLVAPAEIALAGAAAAAINLALVYTLVALARRR